MHRPGIEPGSRAWEARILPLNHRCLAMSSSTKRKYRVYKSSTFSQTGRHGNVNNSGPPYKSTRRRKRGRAAEEYKEENGGIIRSATFGEESPSLLWRLGTYLERKKQRLKASPTSFPNCNSEALTFESQSASVCYIYSPSTLRCELLGRDSLEQKHFCTGRRTVSINT